MSETDNIELRSEKVRHIIGKVPPLLVRTGTVVVTLVVIALAVAFYTIRYPITIEVEGRVMPHDTLQIVIPYKYLYLFTEPRQVSVTYEGEDTDVRPHVYSITSFSRRLLSIGSDNYFIAKASIASDKSHVQLGQKAEGQIIVSDKTLWQQVFR
ncbi:hypothetical protein [Hallella multisaccharivorax]|uniref:hypothetical protein n=1 Tax=Hallella multisaccharivorax TaxID=310514 RepID=UPI00361AB64B